MIRVVLADDHHLVRQSFQALLAQTDDIHVVGAAADGYEAIGLVQRLTPDVLVTDIAMPRLNGIEVLIHIRAQHMPTHVMILSMYSQPALVRRALYYGSRGYLLKSSAPEELPLAIRAASRGESYLSPPIANMVLTDVLTWQRDAPGSDPLEQFSPRERQVLQLLTEGHTNREIAHILELSVKTVEKHRSNLLLKLNVHNLAQLIQIAHVRGLIVLDEPTAFELGGG